MSLVDIFWLTAPVFDHAGPEFHVTDWLAIVGIGGLWLWRFTSQLKGRPLLPLHRPTPQGNNAAYLEAGVSELDFADVHSILREGLHEFLDGLQTKMNTIGECVLGDFFVHAPAVGAAG